MTLDLLKQIESEVLVELSALGEKQQLLGSARVSPAQLLGIEVNPRARAIAELVLWLGHLQWHFRTAGRMQPPPEPVLQNLKNIELRDAVLAWDREELVRDEKAKPVTRWDGVTMKKSPVTGEMIPDENAQMPIYKYINPRKAEWPKADFIVGNPPFVGNKRMRLTLGDGYVEALRQTHNDVPETVDYVMYWWNHAAGILQQGNMRRFGFITTNSITQTFNRKIIDRYTAGAKDSLSIVFAIPDHPWVDTENGAAVRIAMTTCMLAQTEGKLARVIREDRADKQEVDVVIEYKTGFIHSNLTVGPKVAAAIQLRSNLNLSFQGVIPLGEGFRLDLDDLSTLNLNPKNLPATVRRFVIGRDIAQQLQRRWVIDFFGYSEAESQRQYPSLYQHILVKVKPERDQNRRATRRRNWWLFGENAPKMRRAITGLKRFIATIETSRHKPFVFLDGDVLVDHKIYSIASDDAFVLGVLSSHTHTAWALAAGGRLGVGNDPTWTNTTCFLPFPFPACTDPQKNRIRELGEALDAHRKRQQAAHPGLTITGMYNVLEKLRPGEALNDKEKLIHQQGLVSVLKQIHDDLDAAVFDAYGWPRDLSDEQILEKLVALNAERAEEERNGHIRWLRPEFQNPGGEKKPSQTVIEAVTEEEAEEQPTAAPLAKAAAWPKKSGERIKAIRDLIGSSKRLWSAAEVAGAFKGAKKKDVLDLLEGLTGVGVLVAYGESEKEMLWGATGRTAA